MKNSLEKLWINYKLPDDIIKRELVRTTHQKEGKKAGIYYRKRHTKRFQYELSNEIDRENARNKAINLIKYAYWHKEFMRDYPEPTFLLIYIIGKTNFSHIYSVVNEVKYFQELKDEVKKDRNYWEVPNKNLIKILKEKFRAYLPHHFDVATHFYLSKVEQGLNEKLYKSFGPLLEDRHSNFRDGRHGRKRFVPKGLKEFVFERDTGICQHCGIKASEKRTDHIIPVTFGGPSTKWNLQLLCRDCNQRKLHQLETKELKLAIERLRKYAD